MYRPIAALLLLTLFLCTLNAQLVTGSVAGRVTDPSGAVVADAAVTLTQTATGFARHDEHVPLIRHLIRTNPCPWAMQTHGPRRLSERSPARAIASASPQSLLT